MIKSMFISNPGVEIFPTDAVESNHSNQSCRVFPQHRKNRPPILNHFTLTVLEVKCPEALPNIRLTMVVVITCHICHASLTSSLPY
jgi:hypothetical protein